ncbi:MAG: LPS-assembly protein LptD [Paludibacteraceae bacterium]|nr:LPS-assembly protein LptD [Paludibacteraceae bacterium]
MLFFGVQASGQSVKIAEQSSPGLGGRISSAAGQASSSPANGSGSSSSNRYSSSDDSSDNSSYNSSSKSSGGSSDEGSDQSGGRKKGGSAVSSAQDESSANDETAATEKGKGKPPRGSSKIDSPVSYSSKDSVVMLGNGNAFLHGSGTIQYQSMNLESEYIKCNLDSSTIYARGVLDTVENEWIGKPVFKDSRDEYESNEIVYNLSTKRGIIRNVVTQQGEGYILAEKTKKMDDDVMMMAGGKYTTCDNHDHPHFYLNMSKAKVKPGEYIAAGPAWLVVGDVPLPLAIPFGFFPFTDRYSSGLIMPNFGDNYERGLYFSGLGYYFALCDYADLEITGDIYTKGTWAIYAKSKYLMRYKFSGNISLNYRNDVTGERDMPDYVKSTNFSIQWTHTQDSKANPYNNFSASVNFSTSGYNRSNINSYYNPQLNSENTKSSSINYTQRFPDSPWSISMSALISQRTKDSTMSLTLPDLSVNMSRVYPFKFKKRAGKEKWYERISLSYTGNGKIAVNNIKEDYLLHSNFLKDWQTGLKHNIPITASFTVLKYLSITPSIRLTDRMYFQRVDQVWDESTQALRKDTTNGFYNVFDFDASLSFQTKIYGFYTPFRKLFKNGKVDKFRHIITPSFGFSYHPDFGKKGWGYYGSYDQPVYTNEIDPATGLKIQEYDAEGNPVFIHQTYSRYAGSLYGNAPNGASAKLNFGVANNLEVKIRNDKDTTGKEPFKVYSVIDNFSVNSGYNFIADSMNWDLFSVNLRIKIPKVNYTINLSTTLDPYMYELNALGTPVRTNKQYWHNKRFPHWSGTNFSLSYTFNNQTFKKWFGKKDKGGSDEESPPDDGNMDPTTTNEDGTLNNAKRRGGHDHEAEVDEGYVKTEFPWSFSISYSLRYGNSSVFNYEKMQYEMELTHNLSLSGSLGLGSGWKISGSASFDFKAKKFSSANFTVTRDLHCWSMSCSFVPIGPFKSYNFHIGVNASMLADLKYDKSSTDSTNKQVSWW